MDRYRDRIMCRAQSRTESRNEEKVKMGGHEPESHQDISQCSSLPRFDSRV